MKGLLLKQWYQIRTRKIFLLIPFVFLIAYIFKPDNLVIRMMPLLMVLSFTEGCYSRDDRSGWLTYQMTLPVSNRTIVGAYYLFYILMTALIFILQLGCLLFLEQKDAHLIRLLSLLGEFMLIHALTFYEMVRFGDGYVIPALLVTLGLFLVIMMILDYLSPMPLSAVIPKTTIMIWLLALGILAEYISYRASIRLYDEKRISI